MKLARLGVRGAVLDTTAASAAKYDRYVPLLGPDNKLDPSVIGAATPTLGQVKADLVTFTTPPAEDPNAVNVEEAINNITKDDTGLAVMRAKNLADLADPETAFNTIKLAAEVVDGEDTVVAGVVGIATQAQIDAAAGVGVNEAEEPSLTSVMLAVPPVLANYNYLSKRVTTAQTLASPLVLPAAPTTDLQAATKKYVDDSAGGAVSLLTGLTVWVDSVNGSDTTGERGKMTKPVRTLYQAKTLAVSGDIIIVRPGTYNENDLAKNGVYWYFQPGAKIIYTGASGTPATAIFNVAVGETCYVFGYGEFHNQRPTATERYVLYVRSTSKCVFEANWVQSYRTAIYVDCGAIESGGYAQINIRDSLRSSEYSSVIGSSAAIMASGICYLTVGREIYSAASDLERGLTFGSNSGLIDVGSQIVRCPRIIGVHNAIYFCGSARAQVYTDTCYTTEGSAVIANGGSQNLLSATSDLYTDSESASTITLTKGRLICVDTIITSEHAAAIIAINAATNDAYLVLNNTELWGQGYTSVAIGASNAVKIRIIGSAQSDCVKPADANITWLGASWDYIAAADA